ncbi:hypothetical protein PBI_MAHDIA_54 [Gordonia phage Mahdia]|uniref:Uncharacterized protein n=1 Tax=Gordonia phage Mahdia TaxID=2047873 RepID=A0A2H4P9Y8_9CAUD|nr:hypothetical protein FDJ14_gp54 [Gordonia phage Mahdia]ATW59053.1 hypothetical protein PBI_MAHDIA_54 [Gordonia phage Mahdia]
MSKPRTRVHNVILAVNEADAVAAMQRDPSVAGWSVITRESQLHGLMIDQWAITERAASNMRQLPKMIRYLGGRTEITEKLRSRGEL